MGTAEEEMKRMEEEARRRQEEALKNPDILAGKKDPVGDLKNLSDAMSRDASLIGERSEVLEEEKMQPAAPEIQQEAPTVEPNTPQPVAAPNIPADDHVIMGADTFEGKGKSFFNPDTDKGFWQMLDKKIEDVLNAKDPQEMMEKAFWMVLGLFFDTINAELDHHKAEKKRLKDEYKQNTQAYDTAMGTKPADTYAQSLKQVLDALPPELQKYCRDGSYHFEEMNKSDRKAMAKFIKKTPAVFETIQKTASKVSHREFKKEETKEFIDRMCNLKSPLDLNRVRNDVAQAVQGKPLKDPAVGATVEIGSSIRGEAQSVDADARSFSERVASHTADRQAYEQARSGRTSPETGRPFVRGRGNEGNAA